MVDFVVPDELLDVGPAELIERWLGAQEQKQVMGRAGERHHLCGARHELAEELFVSLAAAGHRQRSAARQRWANEQGLSWRDAARLISMASSLRRSPVVE